MLEDARPAALITTSQFADKLGDMAPRMILFDRDAPRSVKKATATQPRRRPPSTWPT